MIDDGKDIELHSQCACDTWEIDQDNRCRACGTRWEEVKQ